MSFIKYIFQFFPTLVEFKVKPFIAILKAISLVLVGLVGMIFVVSWNLFLVGLRVLSIVLLVVALGGLLRGMRIKLTFVFLPFFSYPCLY
jgi:hypothetical protein